jgi:hypothetical protein
MEPSSQAPVGKTEPKNYFCRVTPLSKYLAMALFVAMPFIGGYVGYVYAPVKVVEVSMPMPVISPEKTDNSAALEKVAAPIAVDSDQFALLPSYVPEFEVHSSDLFDRNTILTSVPFSLTAHGTQRKYEVLYFSREGTPCDNVTVDCSSVATLGDRYEARIANGDASDDDFQMKSLRARLENQGFIFLYAVEKSMQHTEIYQKKVDDQIQLVKIQKYPINIRFIAPDSFENTNDGYEYSIFVGLTFLLE